MTAIRPNRIEMIPISRITVLNPRARNKRQHREIVNNIEAIGLKRPITVSRHDGPGGTRYDLVCGEGRLEAFQMLGQTEIPAVVIEATENECLVMSLVENIARRVQRPIDLMREIGALRSRGFNDAAIAKKIGVGASWVNMIASLLERGEERLVAAVETGLIPITLAMEISKAETEEAQNLLLDAYETGQLRGKRLAAVRRMLDMRMQSQRKGALPVVRLGRKGYGRRLTANELMQVYQREAEKQRLLVKKSDFTQTRLLFIVEALKELLNDESFVNLLRAEGLATMPKALSIRISGEKND
ncbi:plasmid partitioning protein RepB C-terminal domain-containing protein [Acidomonas methanolica]|uniref:Chromosome partitioning nuclease protein ParB n=1 Tax=Acidomonas methanolica NBRC 104435 TaxID=1231351 RepID=A0A023D6M9_ACIMT|nr:plasmid partitioning protein RepB C-terminal domain-containing protein [Acidomonas methanolica]MBU2655519.1 ParB N-terminal domain-containing protein [Acidomonas methanolica]TCS21704.1 ParB family chromosome partitioning protein [Acidomonas methanolica]GAJ29798.1 chromosome partitioning nuclease protein ParB [Acidomonas methanolica NBRC 104435]GBQ46872.1 chromosome partitioning protein ParB [Acidomonas methanolica]GEL00355.1 chromosome partitioning protein ParB [Acidomonas methanolica NBRC 